MKKLFLFAISSILLTGCTSNEYRITGRINENSECTKVMLLNNLGEIIDSCYVADNSFTFIRSVEHQTIHSVCVNSNQANVFVQNGAEISVDFTSMPATVIDKGGLNDIYNTFMETISVSQNAIAEKAQGLLLEGKSHSEALDYIKTDVMALFDIYRDAINENKDNIVGAQILSMVAHELYPELAELDSVISEVKYATEIKVINQLRSRLNAAQATE